MERSGFSLVEMLTVLALISLVVVALGFHWSEPYHAVTFQADVERIVDFDFKSRRHALDRNKHCGLIYDLDRGVLEASRWSGATEKFLGLQVSSNTKIAKLVLVQGAIDRGNIELDVSPRGATKTYAVQLKHGKLDQWIVFAGRTGQHHFFDEESDVKTLFEKTQLQGADSD